jgi:hypothetical protein
VNDEEGGTAPSIKKKKVSKKGKKISKYCGRSSGMKKIERYKKCNEKEVCDVGTGYCVPSTSSIKKGRYTLEVDGRSLIGDKETIDKLHKTLGGSITEGKRERNEKPTKKLESPKKLSIVASPEKKNKKLEGDVKVVSPLLESKRQLILDTFYTCMKEHIK